MIPKCPLILAGIIFLSLPLTAQENNTAASKIDSREPIAKTTGEAPTPPAAVRLRSRNIFALPDAPHPTPFPAAAGSTDEPPGRLLPRYEVAGGYSYVNYNPGGPFGSFDNNGGFFSAVSNPFPYFCLF